MSHKNINLIDHKDLESICRLCLADSVSLLEIFPSDQVKDPTQCTIPQKIYYCTSLEVSEIDGLPTHICTECCRQVNIAHTFKLRCLVTDAKLRQHLHSLRKFSVQSLHCGVELPDSPSKPK